MKLEETTVTRLFHLEHTIAADFLRKFTYPWECLPHIGAFVLELGAALPAALFEKRGEDIWIAKSAHLAANVTLTGPAIIDEEAELRPGAYLRGNVIIGKKAVVGNSTEVKNAILFDGVQVPHFNYVGDSVLGYKAHMGAGCITSNVKSDKTPVFIRCDEEKIATGRKKVGAFLGDGVEIGCNSVLNPGTVLGMGCSVYPLSSVRGCVDAGCIYKDACHIVTRA